MNFAAVNDLADGRLLVTLNSTKHPEPLQFYMPREHEARAHRIAQSFAYGDRRPLYRYIKRFAPHCPRSMAA